MAGGAANNSAGEFDPQQYVGEHADHQFGHHGHNGTGVVGLTKVGTGLAVLAGTNTYTGETTIGLRTLSLVGAWARWPAIRN